jgi:uncharacterized membrane protein
MIHRIIENALSYSLYPSKEYFNQTDDTQYTQTKFLIQFFASIIALVIILILLGFIGVFLWNNYLAGRLDNSTGLITIFKPATSIWQIIGLYVFILLITPH